MSYYLVLESYYYLLLWLLLYHYTEFFKLYTKMQIISFQFGPRVNFWLRKHGMGIINSNFLLKLNHTEMISNMNFFWILQLLEIYLLLYTWYMYCIQTITRLYDSSRQISSFWLLSIQMNIYLIFFCWRININSFYLLKPIYATRVLRYYSSFVKTFCILFPVLGLLLWKLNVTRKTSIRECMCAHTY